MTPPIVWGQLPALMQGCLLSLGLDELRFQDIASTDWARTWHGWHDVQSCTDDANAMAWTQRFLRVAAQNSDVGCRSNGTRVLELARDGFRLVPADGAGNNCPKAPIMLKQHIMPK